MTHDQPITDDRPEATRVLPRPTIWWDKSDRISFYFLLAAVPGVAALGGIVRPVLDWVEGKPMVASRTGQIDFPDVSVEQLSSVTYDSVSATIYLDTPSTAQRLLGLVIPALVVLVLAWIAVMLYRINRDIQRGYAFMPANMIRLRWIGMVIGLSGLVWSIGPPIVAGLLLPNSFDPANFSTTFNVIPMGLCLVAGLTCGMLSQAFSVGGELADEVSEVI